MKIIHTSMLLPIILGGCSLPHRQPASSDALQFVDAQIQTNTQIIILAQDSLKQASAITQRAPIPELSSSLKSSVVASNSGQINPSSIRGLKNAKSLGTPGLFTLINQTAQNQSLDVVLRQIVPQGWTVEFSADLKTVSQQRVNLEANDQWPFALDRLLIQHQLVALINWPTQRVSIARWTASFNSAPVATVSPAKTGNASASIKSPPVISPGPRNPFSASRTAGSTVIQPGKTAPSSLSPPPVPAKIPVIKTEVKPAAAPNDWRAEKGSTLKDTLFLWAANAKCIQGENDTWSVVWMTDVNYRIDAPLSFSGSFREALNGVFRLYTTATVPLYAGISTTQCLIKVDDKEVR
ncbi:pilus assembly protein PilL (plasmid) [Yersinia similis]|uniref:Pilus assembly protein PilL n=1 Tax=Yersinia similis TaxID=367190 RepID=A0ABN4CXJ9_9GAMM|nr:toxin co-regulated pilus biosynthesis Q family protein [Yersinia similis]AHK22057.1 pilus assembly protein PilL [Yersinia similis]